jgi:ParB family chromosome partitioning protein
MNSDNNVVQIPIEDLVPNRFQPRINFDEKALNDLANSIKQHGIIQPLVVRRLGDKYEIIAGERRYKAAQIAGLVSVPGIVANVNDQSSAEIALVENVQRKDLSAIEEARSYRNILDAGDMTQDELAKRMGLSQSAIANKLRLLNLSNEAQQALLDGKISERHARSLLSVSDKGKQVELLKRVLDERLTVRQLDELIKNINNPGGEDVLDDVPLVDINGNLEEMQREATDINPLVSRPSFADGESGDTTNNKFFKYDTDDNVEAFTSDEVTNLGRPKLMPQDINRVTSESDFFNFGNSTPVEPERIPDPEPQNDIQTNNMVEEVLDMDNQVPVEEIDSLDVQPGVGIFDGNSQSAKVSYKELAEDVRGYVEVLNVDKNITLTEADNGNSYRIIIDIKKDS